MTQPIPAADSGELHEGPATDEPRHGIEAPADGSWHELSDGDDPLAAAEAVNYARALHGHRPPGGLTDEQLSTLDRSTADRSGEGE